MWSAFTKSILNLVCSCINKVGFKFKVEKVEAYFNMDLGMHFFFFLLCFLLFFKSELREGPLAFSLFEGGILK